MAVLVDADNMVFVESVTECVGSGEVKKIVVVSVKKGAGSVIIEA